MIRYDFSRPTFESEINGISATWMNRAAVRTQQLIAAGAYSEGGPSWGTVKPAFMKLQRFKCCFCERSLAGPQVGNADFDVEHFRPKSSVKVWPGGPNSSSFSSGVASTKGYFWLAFEIENYAASCRPCNSTLKSNYFPIGGTRKTSPATTAALRSEKPYLCHPLDPADEDPERLVTFVATTAIPAASSGVRNKRGRVIIDFFRLNGRDELHYDRARQIALLGGMLSRLEHPGLTTADRNRLRMVVDACHAPDWPHAACSRAFVKLWGTDRTRAGRILLLCEEYVATAGRSGVPDV